MNAPRLSILIPTLPSRAAFLRRLRGVLDRQCAGQPVEVILDERLPAEATIGAKRNALLKCATGDYVAMVDDDDLVSPRYVQLVLAALRNNPDCAELWGIITEDGKNPKKFHHSIVHQEWCERNGVYLRYCNHLNAIRRDLALKAGFPDNSYGEDKTFSDRVKPLLKTMGAISQVTYRYEYRSKK
jgi:glycosyltransferase involved in cell wall biosynthesis